MIIEEIKVMNGPNIWSDKHQQLIVLKFTIENENIDIEGIRRGLSYSFPSLKKALDNVALDKPSSHILADFLCLLYIDLQNNSGGSSTYYNMQPETDFVVVTVEYEFSEHGKETMMTAFNILTSLLNNETPLHEGYRQNLLNIYRRVHPGPSTTEIINEAKKVRNIPVYSVVDAEYIVLGQGIHQKKIQAAVSELTGMIAVDVAGNKDVTKKVLKAAMLPVPDGSVISDERELESVIENLGFPLVTKPLNGHQGKCITTNIKTTSELTAGFKLAKTYSEQVVIEKFITGNDYRFLVINYKLVAVAHRFPATIVGDGISTIQQLVEEVNADSLRGDGHDQVLTKITIDDITHKILSHQQLTVDHILRKGQHLVLKDTANLSTGGTAVDVMDNIHPENILLAERVARVIGLDICGIDIMATDVTQPFDENNGYIIEVNAAPGLRMHAFPSKGKPRPVGKAIVDMLFPKNSGRIPVVAVTGTNGKTTTTRLMAHLAQQNGFYTGFTVTDGIYLNNKQIVTGDCSGPRSAAIILQDPITEFAVLECARGGILRSGLAFDECDVGIVTNVASDHLGLKDIHTLEDMARVKAVIPKSVKETGLSILNAADNLVYQMRGGLRCRFALFCIDPNNPRIVEHCYKGGLAAVLKKNGMIAILDGHNEKLLMDVKDVPLTIGGKAGFMTENVLAAVLAAYDLKFPLDVIRKGLNNIHPTEEQMPGRMNMFSIADRTVVVDYAHNEHGIKAFSDFIKKVDAHKIGIITGVGDRRSEDIIAVGKLASEIYNDIIIRIDKDTRGREPDEIARLLKQGMHIDDTDYKCVVIPDMKSALRHALNESGPGDYIILNVDGVSETLDIVRELKMEFEKEEVN